MIYLLQVVIKIIDLPPFFFLAAGTVLLIRELIIMYILAGLGKKEMKELKHRILSGEEKPYLKKLKRLAYLFFFLTFLSYLKGVFIS